MLKSEAVQIFKEILKELPDDAVNDKCAINLEWQIFIDNLHRGGDITNHQVTTWVCPL